MTAADVPPPLRRFPGSRPFGGSDLERLLFRGRATEARDLRYAILSSNVTVLYARSGAGKTSLLEAAVLPELQREAYWPVMLRLNDVTRSPLDLVRAQLREPAAEGRVDLVGDGDDADTLWDHLARLQAWHGATRLTPVLVFDQFEELFTLDWEHEQREAFFADIGHIAQRYRPRPGEAGDTGDAAPQVKIVFSIREDALGNLEDLAKGIPRILANRFRLRPLAREAAREAITAPAALVDDRLASLPFAFSEDAVELILDFAVNKSVPGRETVEPWQLQVVCSHVELNVVTGSDGGGPRTVTVDDLGGEPGLDRILGEFYADQISQLPSHAQDAARDLCETALIDAGRRISLDEIVIGRDHGVPAEVLDQLVESTLLRMESRLGSRYYELAHDSLVDPILRDREQRETDRRRRRERFWTTVQSVGFVAAVVAFVVFLFVQAILDSGEDLAGEDLAGESFAGRTDLEEADFSGANLAGADFTDVDLLRADFTGANLAGAILVDANLTDTALAGSDLTGADLTEARLKRADLSRAELKDATLHRANLEAARLPSARAERADFTNADLDGADLTGADLDGAALAGADISRATLDGTSLGTDFTGVDLEDVDLSRAILVEADLAGVDLRDQSFAGSNLLAAVLTGADLSGVDLTDATLRFADLSGASLGGAVLRGANLSGAELGGADLAGADLTDADVAGANLSDARLAGATLGRPDLVIEVVAAARVASGVRLDIRITNRGAAATPERSIAYDVVFLEPILAGAETALRVGSERLRTFGPIAGAATFVERVTVAVPPETGRVVAVIDVCGGEEEQSAGCAVRESDEGNNASEQFPLPAP